MKESYIKKYGKEKAEEFLSRRGKLGKNASDFAKWKKKNNI